MPMPGSQQTDNVDLAYILYNWRWVFRVCFILMILAGIRHAWRGRKWVFVLFSLMAGFVIYVFNFKMSADKMFRQPEDLLVKSGAENKVSDSSLVIVVENAGEARAYPIALIAYHHQVQDSVGGKAVMVTYCSVCRSGRVFEPLVNGKPEKFRLVGMDNFNAMFEDETTKSWWRQETGEAVSGKLKGQFLPELHCRQMTLSQFFILYPTGKVMQPDEHYAKYYDDGEFEQGKSRGGLTGTDTASWKDKSWVLGVETVSGSKAYDWNELKKKRLIHDVIGETGIVIYLAADGQSFGVFENTFGQDFSFSNDTLFCGENTYDLAGRCLQASAENLKPVKAYQEFWHSWKTFHPEGMNRN